MVVPQFPKVAFDASSRHTESYRAMASIIRATHLKWAPLEASLLTSPAAEFGEFYDQRSEKDE